MSTGGFDELSVSQKLVNGATQYDIIKNPMLSGLALRATPC